MKKLSYLFVIFAASLGIGISSCSAFDSEGASISLALPGASSARAISTSGTTPPHTSSDPIHAYEIRARNSNNEMVQKVAGAAPGSTIVIDSLYPGAYKISVLAYHTVGQEFNGVYKTYDVVTYYGIAEVEVSAGEEKSAAITMKLLDDSSPNPVGSYPVVAIYPSGANFFTDGSFDYSCAVTGNGANFYYTGSETSGATSSRGYGYMSPDNLYGITDFKWYALRETFLEPGFSYTFTATVKKTPSGASEPTETYRGSATAAIERSNYATQTDHDPIKVYVR